MIVLRGTAQPLTRQGIGGLIDLINCVFDIQPYFYSGTDPVVCAADGLTGETQNNQVLVGGGLRPCPII